MLRGLKETVNGFLAGILISIGGSVYLSLENKVAGAVFFSVALICICYKGYSLFTGKVGFIPADHSKKAVSALLLGLFGNVLGTAAGGFSLRYAVPAISKTAEALCAAKFSQELPQTAIRALFCGMLMYFAVSIFREYKTVTGIVFCVPVFILSGFEHSIANMFYFSAAGEVSVEAFVYILTVILGNAAGGMLFPLLQMIGGNKDV